MSQLSSFSSNVTQTATSGDVTRSKSASGLPWLGLVEVTILF